MLGLLRRNLRIASKAVITSLRSISQTMEIVKEELQLAQNAFAERVCAWVINISHYNERGEEGGTP